MIGSLRGTILHRQDNWTIIETNSGVGYRIFVGNQGFIPGESTVLYTHHHVREDADDLYGFVSIDDLMIFELLLSVSGVGPKMAQAIQSTLGAQTIMEAVASHQTAIFKSVSGVGQKVADKIVLELKNKVGSAGSLGVAGDENSDLFEALMGLGYRQQEIVTVMKDLDPALSTEERLKQALRLLKK
jgi:Holliday junction DNA helicase RuvA